MLTGLIPATPDRELPAEAKAGVTCDVCHQVSALTGGAGPWKEPGNASFTIQQGMVKFGNYGDVPENRSHSGEKKDFFGSSEFCASCHTVIQPINGFHIETTYDEWKAGVFAQKGIQCQDCHMRSVEEAEKVAQTLRPLTLVGKSIPTNGADRAIHRHYFVGGNANADVLAGGKSHAEMAEARLKGAARLEIKAPPHAAAGTDLLLEVLVHNVAAGHNIPSAVTELRRMWVELQIRDAQGKLLFRNPGLERARRSAAGGHRLRRDRRRCCGQGHVQALGDAAIPLETDHSTPEFHPGHRSLQAAGRRRGADRGRGPAFLPVGAAASGGRHHGQRGVHTEGRGNGDGPVDREAAVNQRNLNVRTSFQRELRDGGTRPEAGLPWRTPQGATPCVA